MQRLFFSFLLLTSTSSFADGFVLDNGKKFITFGANVGYSFLGENPQSFFGLHSSYWVSQDAGNLVGGKLGIEIREGKLPYFTLGAQSGFGLGGATWDLILHPEEIWGTQFGIWANVFLGANLRVRYMNELTIDPNLYLTVPSPLNN